MAFQLGIIQFRGKLGQTVGAKKAKAQKANTIRVHNSTIANPRTVAQADQRMKLLPANLIARQLAELIDRGFEGVDYGQLSRNLFIKYALKQSTGIPYLEKDTTNPVPGRYLLNKGSLKPVQVTAGPADTFTDLLLGSDFNIASATVGTLSAAIVANNVGFEEGDQLTFVRCIVTANGDFVWEYESLYLDSSNTETLASAAPFVSADEESGSFFVIIAGSAGANENIAAAAVLHSREKTDGGHMRSTQYIQVTDTVADEWFSASKKVAARSSYMDMSAIVNSDWPVDQDDNYNSVERVNSTYVISGLTGDKAEANGKVAQVVRNGVTGELLSVYVVDAEIGIYGAGPFLVGDNGRAISYAGPEQTLVGLTPSDVADLAGLPTIPFTPGA
jgi:hypothetical protein